MFRRHIHWWRTRRVGNRNCGYQQCLFYFVLPRSISSGKLTTLSSLVPCYTHWLQHDSSPVFHRPPRYYFNDGSAISLCGWWFWIFVLLREWQFVLTVWTRLIIYLNPYLKRHLSSSKISFADAQPAGSLSWRTRWHYPIVLMERSTDFVSSRNLLWSVSQCFSGMSCCLTSIASERG